MIEINSNLMVQGQGYMVNYVQFIQLTTVDIQTNRLVP